VQLVRHFAGDLERERRYARLAGERAATQYANEEALRYLGRALELTPAGACGHRYELLVARESVYHLVGQRDAQRKDLLELETLAGTLGLEQQAEVAMRMARLAIMTCDHRAAMAAAETAVERAQATGQAGVQAEAHHFWAAGLHHLGDVTAAQTHWAEALALARTCGQRNLEALALSWLAECAADPAQELRYWEEALCVAVRQETGVSRVISGTACRLQESRQATSLGGRLASSSACATPSSRGTVWKKGTPFATWLLTTRPSETMPAAKAAVAAPCVSPARWKTRASRHSC